MPEENLILKNPQLTNDQDYAFLRSEGLKYIEELGSNLWTDYNEHDPGITILEALCYAITELGYRTANPMQDLLTGEDGKISSSQTLYTAKNILTQSPLNSNDYRKLLIDIAGVHNAWLFADDFYLNKKAITPAGEIAIYADCKKDALVYDVTSHPVYLSGLYKVLLDLDNDLQFGDLNNGELQVLSPQTENNKAGSVSLTVIWPAWNKTEADLLRADVSSLVVHAQNITVSGSEFALSINFSFTVGANTLTLDLDGKIVVDLQPPGSTITLADINNFFSNNFSLYVLNLYVLKIQRSKSIVQSAIKKLNENRNLCEDFVSVTTVLDEEVAICCDIDVKPGADMEEVQARVFYAIEDYLNPSIKFYLLPQLIDLGYTTDEIFEGPVLKHGFIDTKQLEQTQLRSEIHTSDIINLLMDIDGVIAVKNFRITKYDINGNPVPGETGQSWCMSVTAWHKPVFSETRSKIIFYKSQFPYLLGLAEVCDTLNWLRALNMRNKLTGHADDLYMPTGKYSPLDSYTSIENLFPLTYGIGKAGLPSTATDERKAQAKQLKAYLLYYDQFLADYFTQLKNAKELFSTDKIVQTYYGQFLDNIKDIDEIYSKNGASQNLLQVLLQNQDSEIAAGNEWQRLYENKETFLDRRNRFLDHLMSRFAESFDDYVLLMYSLDYATQQETKIDPADIINNKIGFLKKYPQVSYERGRAFNYFPQKDNFTLDPSQLWDTDNVSGLEKKSCLLGGIQNYYKRFLYCVGNAKIIATTDTPVTYQFVFTNANNDTLTSVVKFSTEDDANNALPGFLNYVLEETNYNVQNSGTEFSITVTDNATNTLAISNKFPSEINARDSIIQFTIEFNKECDNEGLHLVEHLLLRPRNSQFALAPVCLDPKCDFCGEQDPYSFHISVVLPYWPVHLRSLAFRNYFENMIRMESPAHTTVKVCWVNNSALHDFEIAYKSWITALANYALDSSTVNVLQTANDFLLEMIYNLHSEYPVSTLHDCEESKDTNPVMLGRTILGSFKN